MKIEAKVEDPTFIAKDAGLPDVSIRLYILLYEMRGTEIKNFYETVQEMLGVSKPTLLRAVRALIRAGYIRKERNLDGRTHTIVLTEGKELCEAM